MFGARNFLTISALLAIAELAGLGCALLFAQVVPDATPAIRPPFQFDINNLTAVGILAWYAWYSQTKTIPGVVRSAREQVDMVVKSSQVQVEALVEANREQIEKLTSRYMEDLKAGRDQFAGMIERERQYHHEQSELLRDRVHDMADSAQAQTLRIATAIEDLAKVAGVLKEHRA